MKIITLPSSSLIRKAIGFGVIGVLGYMLSSVLHPIALIFAISFSLYLVLEFSSQVTNIPTVVDFRSEQEVVEDTIKQINNGRVEMIIQLNSGQISSRDANDSLFIIDNIEKKVLIGLPQGNYNNDLV